MQISSQGFETWPGPYSAAADDQARLRAGQLPQSGPELPQVELELAVAAPATGPALPLTDSERTAQALAMARQILHLAELPALENPAALLDGFNLSPPETLVIDSKTYALAATQHYVSSHYPDRRLCLAATSAAETHDDGEIAKKIHSLVTELNASHASSLTPADLLAIIAVSFGQEQDPLLLYSWPGSYPRAQLGLELEHSGYASGQLAQILSEVDTHCQLTPVHCRQLIAADREAFKRFIANHNFAPALAGIGKTPLMYHQGSLTDALDNLDALGAALSDRAGWLRQSGSVPTAEALFAAYGADPQACLRAAADIEISSYRPSYPNPPV